ncbi:hypothetical protein [Denitromonas iodatirespirans]|uniref:NnrS family protein n=1 Tax=Denitromonas iodatirespirans TaxID=2795389 RepID=A0A944HBX0_DENI1|nr:hypothetical protein [Denitromonas iodatirespirans]MBT0962107.1 hypothetical protein [Denitromonas iodatirespirans]
MTDLAPWQRAPLLILGFAGLIVGMLAGLWRLAWPTPAFVAGAPHGALMMCAFFGTLIALERAVAVGRRWAYLGPLAGGLGSAMLIAGLDPRLATVPFGLGGLVLVLASLHAQRRAPALHARVLTLGAVAWLVGVLVWALTDTVDGALWWWIAFLVITIAGERLELSRLMRVSPAMQRYFIVLIGLLVAGASLAAWPTGERLFGLGALGLAIWLFRQDVARRTVKTTGLTRYIAVCLLSGYLWLALGGALLAGLAPTAGQPGWDSALHALTVGFVFAMVFGHAPIILPAVLRIRLPYHPGFYVPLALLHLSLAVRTAGDLPGAAALRAWGALGNAGAIGLFLVLMLTAVAAGRRGR